MRGRVAIVVMAAGMAAAFPAGARAASRADFVTQSDRFTSDLPGTVTGRLFSMRIQDPANPGSKPPALKRETFRLPAGARFDTHAVPACDDSNDAALTAQLLLMGTAACPDGSVIGKDDARLDTGVPGAVVASHIIELNARNGAADEVVFLVQDPQSGFNTFVFTGTITGGDTLTVDVPWIPGTSSDLHASDLGENEETYARSSTVGGVTRGYMTTPPVCPVAGHWTDSTTYEFTDGQTVTVHASLPCRGGLVASSATSEAPSAPGAVASSAAPTGGAGLAGLPNTRGSAAAGGGAIAVLALAGLRRRGRGVRKV